MSSAPSLTIRDTIERDLANEPQSVVRVYETGKLRTDLLEYVLTDQLAHEFGKVLERVVESAQPAGGETDKVGVWVSGFFGSGKSHFAKLAGHLLADTKLGDESARGLFQRLLHPGRRGDERIRELFQQAATYKMGCHLVLFDITALHAASADNNVGLTFLRAFYDSLDLSRVIAFAERELELRAAGQYDAFLRLYEEKTGLPWAEDRDLTISGPVFAECLAELLPKRFASVDLAHRNLEFALAEIANLNVDGVIDRLLRWLEVHQREAGKAPQKLIIVADEVGAWAGGDLKRIEQVRSFVETVGSRGKGRIWLVVTSQEKLSAVVQNAPTVDGRQATDLLQRLEARFNTNVHLESSEVGSVIEERVLRKKPSMRTQLEHLWTQYQQQLRDIAESPGLELGANYPRPEKDAFVRDYPFLPYQIQAAADIFGGMRGVKVSSGARTMIKTVFDATRELADRDLGGVVSWDRIFDSANRDNEFADEKYLGSQGLTYIGTADRDVVEAPIARPSRVLKVLWLVQQSARIPRTPANLARLLVDDLATDVLQLERQVAETLEALAKRSFVRQEVATDQWRFLSQDEVTVEKLVQRLGEDVKQHELRKETADLYAKQLQSQLGGRLTAGKSNTTFEYGVYLNDVALKNDAAPVKLKASLAGTTAAQRAVTDSAANLDDPTVYWVVDVVARLEERLRRALAIERLPNDEEYRRVATERMKIEAEKLGIEAGELRRDIEADVERALQSGSLHWAGNALALVPPPNGRHRLGGQQATAKTKVEEALRDRIAVLYHRFAEGDKQFNAANVDRLFTVPAGGRAALDPDLGLFAPDGHVHGNNVLVEELSAYFKSSTKNAGQDVADRFAGTPYGWQADLLRYVAAAMFADGKLSAIDRPGRRYDDPKAAAARALFGTGAFKTTRLEVEEDSLTPKESSDARPLLSDLKHPPADGGEIELKEATLLLGNDLGKRLGVLDKARAVELPLPSSYEGVGALVDEITGAGSRVKIVRALLAHAQELRDATAALQRLEDFEHHHGFNQYRRSQQLLEAALQAGLADDPQWGAKVQTASDEMQALRDQRRVLDEWNGSFQTYRQDVLDAFKAAYAPLRAELQRRSAAAARAVTDMPEYKALTIGDAALVRVEFLGEGKPLHEVSLPELRDEQQLLNANAEFSIAHLRSALVALDPQLSAAKARVIQLYDDDLRRKGEAATTATWKPAAAFAGKTFVSEADVDDAFRSEMEKIKKLIHEGKRVQVV
ncbi:MAG: BREX system P-loop protein BrxC [Bacteroidetes bacterium]|nr:BREX system P-loop protein BrxC [Bacteroidota bacterium]